MRDPRLLPLERSGSFVEPIMDTTRAVSAIGTSQDMHETPETFPFGV
ncbi:hypothetical protein AWB79_02232 [Caballeronia hypogeia]|uniref:Uncharacterized protein n=1 Tax=Caballeronia hypogeia TaxID=1777140 RepID=A0A158ADQ3_9BURK|nr:hypothetical protein AWB79_02232 [Caballeronia hypogeia]